jgi:UDP-N-acetylmuramate-alanine ligase
MKIHFIGIGGIGISGLAKQAVAVCEADVSSVRISKVEQ